MSVDVAKLTPAPWRASEGKSYIIPSHGEPYKIAQLGGTIANPGMIARDDECLANDADFIALARNAFDVLEKCGCMTATGIVLFVTSVFASRKKNHEQTREMVAFVVSQNFADPFTALVEADKWYRENVESKQEAVQS